MLPTLDHGVAGSNPGGGEILPELKRRFIAQSLSCSPSQRLEMTEILLKGRKTLTHLSIHLFRQSIDTGEIQREWPLTNICPIFKKSARSRACMRARSYRLVSLTCVSCKLPKHIVCSNVMAHLDEYNLLSDRKHAFRNGHSCETQLTTVINYWAKLLDNRGQGLIHTEFRKRVW